jgi:hypothetical protein
VTDQLRVKYSCQLLSHKWWMKLLCFILDQSTVNIYVIYLEGMEELGLKPLKDGIEDLAMGSHSILEVVFTV